MPGPGGRTGLRPLANRPVCSLSARFALFLRTQKLAECAPRGSAACWSAATGKWVPGVGEVGVLSLVVSIVVCSICERIPREGSLQSQASVRLRFGAWAAGQVTKYCFA